MSERIYKKLAEISSRNSVELKSEVLELGIGDESRKLISKLESAYKNVNKEVNIAFQPIREIEKLSSQIPKSIDGFKSFTSILMDLESQFDKDNKKITTAEKELGIKIPRPKVMDSVVKSLAENQKREELLRGDINEFNKFAKKYK